MGLGASSGAGGAASRAVAAAAPRAADDDGLVCAADTASSRSRQGSPRSRSWSRRWVPPPLRLMPHATAVAIVV